MPMENKIVGAVTGAGADVNASGQLKIAPEVDAANSPGNVGGVRIFGENDQGLLTGVTRIASAEIDIDYRQRVSHDLLLDDHIFNYTAQDTGKHLSGNATITNAWTVGNFTTNAANTAAPAAGSFAGLATWATFPNTGTQTLAADATVAFSAQPTTNTFIEFGFAGANYVASATAPTDGVFFRLTSAGLQLITANSGTETSSGVFPLSGGAGVWQYLNDKKYQFIAYMGGVAAQAWVNDGTGAVLLGHIPLPSGQGRICSAQGLRFFLVQRVVGGAAGGAIQGKLGAYNVRLGGSNLSSVPSTQGNRIFGSYQGASGGTMGSLATYANSANPVAAAPINTALAANLPALGGQGAVIAALASAVDGIWASYQVPVPTVSLSGRRLVVRGVTVDLINNGAAVATTPTVVQFCVAFGHTAASLATAEAVNGKAARRVALGFASWAVGAAVGESPKQGRLSLDVGDAPIFVNPGEHFQLVGKFVLGTATPSQTLNFTYTPIFGWE